MGKVGGWREEGKGGGEGGGGRVTVIRQLVSYPDHFVKMWFENETTPSSTVTSPKVVEPVTQ